MPLRKEEEQYFASLYPTSMETSLEELIGSEFVDESDYDTMSTNSDELSSSLSSSRSTSTATSSDTSKSKSTKKLTISQDVKQKLTTLRGVITLDALLNCPLCITSFSQFLQTEFSRENLYCYFDLNLLLNYLKGFPNFVRFLFDESSFKQHIDNLGKKIPTEEELFFDETLLVKTMNKFDTFVNEYIGSTAPSEVNISLSVMKGVVSSYEAFQQLKEQIDNVKDTKQKEHLYLDQVKPIIDNLKNLRSELLINLKDSFARYLYTSYFEESWKIYLGAEGDVARTKLILSEKKGVVLNTKFDFPMSKSARHPSTVCSELLKKIVSLLNQKTFWSDDMTLDLSKVKTFKKFNLVENAQSNEQYERWEFNTAELTEVDLDLLMDDDEERLSFFINLYNLMMIHSILLLSNVPKTKYHKSLFQRKIRYNVGGLEFSLHQIREGILLGNKSKHCIFGKPLKKREKKAKYILKNAPIDMLFCLIDFTNQSPKINIYDGFNVAQQVQTMANQYVTNSLTVKPESDKSKKMLIQLPEIYKEYQKDIQTYVKSGNATEKLTSTLKKNKKMGTSFNDLERFFKKKITGKKSTPKECLLEYIANRSEGSCSEDLSKCSPKNTVFSFLDALVNIDYKCLLTKEEYDEILKVKTTA